MKKIVKCETAKKAKGLQQDKIREVNTMKEHTHLHTGAKTRATRQALF